MCRNQPQIKIKYEAKDSSLFVVIRKTPPITVNFEIFMIFVTFCAVIFAWCSMLIFQVKCYLPMINKLYLALGASKFCILMPFSLMPPQVTLILGFEFAWFTIISLSFMLIILFRRFFLKILKIVFLIFNIVKFITFRFDFSITFEIASQMRISFSIINMWFS